MRTGHGVLVALALLAMSSTAAADPTKPECIAANEKAQDLRQAGKLRAAREQLAVCIAQSCPGPVREDCAQRLAEVSAAQPTIVFAAKDGAGNDVDHVTVTIDGAPFAEKLDGSALEVDPGDHTFRFETAEGVTSKHIVVREGDKGRREAVALGATIAAPASSPPTGQNGSMQRTTGLVLGGVGVAGLVVGSIFGALALSQKSTAQSACPGTLCANKTGADDWSTAVSSGNVSTIALVVGVVGVAGAAVLWFTAPSSSSGPGTQMGFGPGSVQLKSTW